MGGYCEVAETATRIERVAEGGQIAEDKLAEANAAIARLVKS
jgi:hypothetical protein